MSTDPFCPHPFGQGITPEALITLFTAQHQWEDKYRQLILLGKQLPPMSADRRATTPELSGCENRVWLGAEYRPDGTLHFYGDSEGRIVRGLLAILLTAVEGKTAQQLLEYSPLQLFERLGLSAQLSASRNSGLTAMANAVREIALKSPHP